MKKDDSKEQDGTNNEKDNDRMETKRPRKEGDEESLRQRKDDNNITNNAPKKKEKPQKIKTHVLKRKRFHNFTSTVMAHEFLAYRRLDRFFHRATVRFDENDAADKEEELPEGSNNAFHSKRPFLALTLTGDLFLNGQARRVIALFLAICRGCIDEDILDCVFDEEYTNLVPIVPLPSFGMYAECETFST
mmetsp:Transcript_14530/g.21470  ORF Transcript_14530/g.21470 Transcript_14530/m.21470 type:complete len:190 (-) Transcript_14530:1180-1749(-)